MMAGCRGLCRGFTLVEVIVTLLLVAVFAAMMYSVLGAPLTQSARPLHRLTTSMALEQVMENFIADFRKNFSGDVSLLKNAVGAEGTDQNNGYGQYSVVHNRFIKFTGQAEAAWSTGDPQTILKVTIRNANNETLTAIFTQ